MYNILALSILFIITPCIYPILAPTIVDIQAFDTNVVELLWRDNSLNEDGFLVKRRALFDTAFILIDTIPSNSSSCIDSSVSGGNTYYYTVYSYNSLEVSTGSNIDSITTPPTAIVILRPPQNIIATWDSSTKKIKLSFSDSSINEQGYYISRQENGGDFRTISTIHTNALPSTGEVVWFDSIGEGYYNYYFTYKVQTVDDTMLYGVSNSVFAGVYKLFTPHFVLGLDTIDLCVQIRIYDNNYFEDGYRIYRRGQSGVFSLAKDIPSINPVNTDSIDYEDSFVDSNDIYYYYVEAYSNSRRVSSHDSFGIYTYQPPLLKPVQLLFLGATSVHYAGWAELVNDTLFVDESIGGVQTSLLNLSNPADPYFLSLASDSLLFGYSNTTRIATRQFRPNKTYCFFPEIYVASRSRMLHYSVNGDGYAELVDSVYSSDMSSCAASPKYHGYATYSKGTSCYKTSCTSWDYGRINITNNSHAGGSFFDIRPGSDGKYYFQPYNGRPPDIFPSDSLQVAPYDMALMAIDSNRFLFKMDPSTSLVGLLPDNGWANSLLYKNNLPSKIEYFGFPYAFALTDSNRIDVYDVREANKSTSLGNLLTDYAIRATRFDGKNDRVLIFGDHELSIYSLNIDIKDIFAENNPATGKALLQIYPNPLTARTTIKLSPMLTASTIHVYNIKGQIVYSVTHLTKHEIGLNLSCVPAGIYFIAVRGPNLSLTKKLVILK